MALGAGVVVLGVAEPAGASTTPIVVVNQPGQSFLDTLAVGAPALLPGGSAARALTVENAGPDPVEAFTLDVSARPLAPIVSSPNGLVLSVERCNTTWHATRLADGGWRYGCTGTLSATAPMPLAEVLSAGVALTGLAAQRPGGIDHLVVVLELPQSASDRLAGESTTLSYSLIASLVPGATPAPLVAQPPPPTAPHHPAPRPNPLSATQLLDAALRGPLPQPAVVLSWLLLFAAGIVGGMAIPEAGYWMRRFVTGRWRRERPESQWVAGAAAVGVGAVHALTVSWAWFALIGFAIGMAVRLAGRWTHRFVWSGAMAHVPALPSPRRLLLLARSSIGAAVELRRSS